jgi:hypothetical protein
MAGFDVKLTIDGMKNVPLEMLQNDFDFVVGSDTYQCPRWVAAFLSPKISQLYTADPTVTAYLVETEDPLQQFSQFLSLAYGSSLVVTDSNRRVLLSLARELANTELQCSIMSEMKGNLSVEKVRALVASDPDFFQTLGAIELEFLASNFWTFDWETLNSIPLSTLFDILGHPSLRIQTENWLYYFVVSKLLIGREYFQLFRYVLFAHVWTFGRRHFLKLARDYPEYFETTLDAITDWAEMVKPKDEARRYKRMDNVCQIFDRLTQSFDGNLHEAGIVTVTTKSNCEEDWSHARNILDPDLNTGFESEDEPNQWICCDFHDRRVVPDYLALYTDMISLSMKVEGSIDGETWTDVHTFGGTDPDGIYGFCRVVGISPEKFRFIRLTQTGLNSKGNYRLGVKQLRLQGAIVETLPDEIWS